jgi:hypothetical protein
MKKAISTALVFLAAAVLTLSVVACAPHQAGDDDQSPADDDNDTAAPDDDDDDASPPADDDDDASPADDDDNDDANGPFGATGTAVAIGTDGDAHVLTNSGDNLTLYSWLAGAWSHEVVGANDADPQLAAGVAGSLHAAYLHHLDGPDGPADLIYATNRGGQWEETTLAHGNASVEIGAPSLAVNAGADVHVLYNAVTEYADDLIYAVKEDGVWTQNAIPGLISGTYCNGLAVDSAGVAYISCLLNTGFTSYLVLQISNGSGQWTTKFVAAYTGALGDYIPQVGEPQIAVDGGNHSDIVCDYCIDPEMGWEYCTLTYNFDGIWQAQWQASIGSLASLAVAADAADRPHIFLVDGALKHFTMSNGALIGETVDAGAVDGTVSAATAPNDKVAVAYVSGDELKFAEGNTGAWTISVVAGPSR